MDKSKPHQGAKVALFLGQKLIAIHRDDKDTIAYPNLWDLPGGGREGDETTFETMSRELREELGLTITTGDILWESAFPSSTDPSKWNAFFVAQQPALTVAKVRFGNEGQGWGLYGFDEFINMPNRVPSYGDRLRKWVDETGGLPGAHAQN